MKLACPKALVICLAALLVAVLECSAANVGPSGYTNSFDVLPAVGDWATSSRAGGTADNYDMDLDVQSNITAAAVSTALTTVATNLGAASLRAVWSSTDFFLQIRPTGNKYSTLMGKFLNASGSNVAELVISYQLTFAGTTVAEEPGRGTRVYYSFTGASNTWIILPAFNTVASNGTVQFSTNLPVTWLSGSNLFVLFADDNASAGTDVAVQLDNFSITITAGLAPTVSAALTAPANNALLLGGNLVTASVFITNGAAPYIVRYYTNSGAGNTVFAQAGTVSTPPHDLSLGTLPAGTYNLYATVTDDNGTGTTAFTGTNTFTVANLINFTLTAPANGASIDYQTVVNGTVSLSGGTAPFSVQWFLDGLANGAALTTPPYSRNFGTLGIGDHTVSATVTDARGWVSNSLVSAVHITGPLTLIFTPTNGTAFNFGTPLVLTASAIGGTPPYLLTIATNGVLIGYGYSPFTTNVGVLPVGVYTAQASALDDDSSETNTSLNTVTILPNPLTAAVSSPTNGQSFFVGQAVTITADGFVLPPLSIARVSFLYDGLLVATDSNAPFSIVYSNFPVGTRKVYAFAVDTLGRFIGSPTNEITILPLPSSVPVGPTGYTNDFSTQPAAYEFATFSRAGAANDTYTADTDVNLNVTSAATTNRPAATAGAPPAANASAVWASAGLYLQTRPTGNRYTVLMGKFQNQTGTNATEVNVSYLLTLNTAGPSEDAGLGLRAYYSLSGATGSWVNIPAFNTTEFAATNFNMSTNLSVNWTNGGTFYIAWIDDNGSSQGTDTADQFDNFSLTVTAGEPLRIGVAVTTPGSNSVYVAGTSLTAAAAIVNGVAPYNVQYFTNSGLGNTVFVSAGTNGTAPYNVPLGTPPAGTYNIYAVVTDASSTSTNSPTNTFFIANPMVATLTAPANNATFSNTAPVSGSVTVGGGRPPYSVQFFLDQVPVGAPDTTAPFDYNFGPLFVGDRLIRATVTDASGWVSNTVTSTVHITGRIGATITPTNLSTFVFGESVTLTGVVAGGTAPYTATLFLNGVSLGAQSTPPFTAALGALAAGSYTCYVAATDSSGPVQATNSVTNVFTVLPNPIAVNLTAPTNGQTATAGATFGVAATASVGAPLSITNVEFFYDGASVGLDTTSPYTGSILSPVAGTHTVYAVAKDNLGRANFSGTNTLIFVTDPLANDIFANRFTLGTPAHVSGNNTGATTQNQEPVNQFSGGVFLQWGATLWWKWIAPFDGTVTIDTFGSGIDTVLNAYTGTAVNQLSLVARNNDAPGAGTASLISFAAVAGTEYQIQVAGQGGGFGGGQPAQGAFQLNLTMPPFVAITNPVTGAAFLVGVPVPVDVVAQSPAGVVTNVSLYRGATLLGSANTAPFSFVATNLPPGSNSLYAVAWDTAGQVATSAVARVLVASVGVTITTPSEDSVVSSAGPLTVAAYTALPSGTITNVDFFLDGAFLGRAGTAPFSVVWSNVVGGSHRVAATGLDDSGNTYFATAVNFGVSPVLVASNSVWKYLDNGSDQGTAWQAPGFDDSTWASGPAPLGYADSNGRLVLTTNSFGPDTNAKYTNTYYRQAFTVSNLAAYSSFTLNIQRDDGAIVYLNGVELARYNMPTGLVTSMTQASGNAADDGGTTFSTVISPSSFVEGVNVFAVEVHQDSANSSDIWFVMDVTGVPIIVHNVSPTVALTAPTNSQSFLAPASIALSATANDADGTVTNVEFFVDGVKIGQTATGNPYQFTWTNPPVAAHALTAVATDNQGGRTTSTVVPIVVYDALGTPVAAITSPANGAVMEGPTNLLITATANALSGVTNVQFLANGVLFANDATPPYSAVWSSSFLSNGLRAVAFAANGMRGTSPVVSVTITIPPTNVIAPTIATQLPPAFATVSNLTNITIVFSERVQNVDASDLLINGVPATSVISSGNLSNYTFRFAQPAYGEVNIAFAPGHGITDYGFPTVLPFDEVSAGASWEYFLIDRTPPVVVARTPAPGSSVTNLESIAVTFSEGVAGVDASDLLLNGVPAFDVSGSGSNYIFSVAQPSSGTISVTWATNHGIYDFSDIPNNFVRTATNNLWSFTLDSRTTFVQSNSTWRFVKGLAEASSPTNAWRELGFNHASWSNAAAPFFFGDPYTNFPAGIYGTELTDMRSNYTTIYLRKEFVVQNKNIMTNLVLNAQSDDGFIAYINGTMVARFNAGANNDLPFNAVSTGTATEGGAGGATYISYGLTNFSSYLVNGTNVLAIHALNNNLTNDTDFGFNAQLYSFIPDFGVVPPRVSLAEPAQGELFALTNILITFSEDVTNVNASDLLVNGVAATGMTSPSNSYYSFTFPQPAFGTVNITWATNHGIVDFDPAPKAFDGNAASAKLTYLLLNPSAPFVAVQTPAASTTVTGLARINIFFNEGVTGVNASDLLINGTPATSIDADSETDYFFFFPQPAFGTVNVRFATNSGIADLQGNAFDWTRPTNQWSYNLINPVPVVNITTPTNGTFVLTPATVTVNATATDADGSVSLVEFYSNGAKVGEDAATPYSLVLSNLTEGGYVLRAVGTDNQGIRGTSAPVVLNVVTQLPIVLLRGPYLQSGTSTGGVVRWRTDQFSDARVRYGTDFNNLTNVAVETTMTNNHVVRITGLQPDTKYFYAMGSSSFQLAGGTNEGGSNFWFRTSPVPGTPKATRFWVLGDPGTANANQQAVRNSYLNMVAAGGKEADLWLMLGDNAYNTGTDTEYQGAVFDMYPTVLRNKFLWPVIGNHDAQQPGTGGGSAANVDLVGFPYLDIFTLPQNAEAGGLPTGNPKYYSFDYANVHFVGLDSMTSGRETNSPMVLWLKDDLTSHTQTWTIVYFHHSLYTHGTHNSDTEADLVAMRQVFNPILDANGVDLVLMGHSHVYERSYLLDGHYGVASTFTASMKVDPGLGRVDGSGAYSKSADDRGVVYSIMGSSGQALGGTLDHPAHAVSLNLLGSLLVDVSSNRLDATFLTSTGTTNDYYTLLKRGPTPTAPTNLVAQFVATNQIRITWSDVATNETGYVIERSLNCVTFTRIATNGPNTTQFLDTGLLANTTYCYRVRAMNGNGDSVASNVASGSTAVAGPVLAARMNALTGARTLSLSGTTGVVYSIDRSTNLSDTAAWQFWQSVILSNTPQIINAGTNPIPSSIFYRARQ